MVLSPREELEIIKARIRAGLIEHGTDVAANERDPEGDGDQSIIVTPGHRQFYRNIFSEGGDFAEYFSSGLASAFSVSCVAGNVVEVKALLEAADQPHPTALQPYASPRLVSLLETRETSMRISPILMMVSVVKNLAVNHLPLKFQKLYESQIQVAELLLQYGARPDAKDVCGKTVCHYGAGSMATEMTRSVVKLCAQAYQTSYLFNQEVELVGLGDVTKNGLRGIARGYMVKTGRRLVYLMDNKGILSIKPENIRLVCWKMNRMRMKFNRKQD